MLADSKVVGTTPARFTIRPGALRVIAGAGPGLAHPAAAAAAAAAAADLARSSTPAPPALALPEAAARRNGLVAATTADLVPVAGWALSAAHLTRALAGPTVVFAAGVGSVTFLRAVTRVQQR